MKNEIFKQVKSITQILLEKNLTSSQNIPIIQKEEIVWNDFRNIVFSLKDSPYEKIYEECLVYKDYNFVMFDQAIIQMRYRFRRDNLLEHVLGYYPNPSQENFLDSPINFEEDYYGTTPFSENIDSTSVKFPLRFDYDIAVHNPCDHPISHLTLGNNTSCRIPVSKALTPNKFMLFILRSFYFEKFKILFTNDDFRCELIFNESIIDDEKEMLHINYNKSKSPLLERL
jgi:hypothetical protein